VHMFVLPLPSPAFGIIISGQAAPKVLPPFVPAATLMHCEACIVAHCCEWPGCPRATHAAPDPQSEALLQSLGSLDSHVGSRSPTSPRRPCRVRAGEGSLIVVEPACESSM